MEHVYAQLRLADAVELGHAWCQRLAQERGIRVLFLKGPAMEKWGLRDRHVSGDVDVLVEPERWAEYVDAIAEAGWREREATASDELLASHSRTFIRDAWPCDIDLHRHYPGMLADPREVFEILWRRAQSIDLAHVPCAIPDRLGAIVILALHSLRGVSSQTRHRRELDGVVSRANLDTLERAELGRLCRGLGCVATLETVLPELGVDTAPQSWELESKILAEWRGLVRSGANGPYRWLVALQHARGKDRAKVLVKALWPSDHDLLIDHPWVADTAAARVGARLRRLVRGIRHVPQAIAAWGARRSGP